MLIATLRYLAAAVGATLPENIGILSFAMISLHFQGCADSGAVMLLPPPFSTKATLRAIDFDSHPRLAY